MREIETLDINPIHLSNYILSLSPNTELVELVKMNYVLYGIFLAYNQIKLFSEQFESWRYGPVIKSVYFHFKTKNSDVYGIPDMDKGFDNDTFVNSLGSYFDAIKAVILSLNRFDAKKLILATHQKDTAWKKAWDRFTEPNNDDINQKYLLDNEIVMEFKKLWKISQTQK